MAPQHYNGRYASSTMTYITDSRRHNSPIGCGCECTLTPEVLRHHYMISLNNVTKVQMKHIHPRA